MVGANAARLRTPHAKGAARYTKQEEKRKAKLRSPGASAGGRGRSWRAPASAPYRAGFTQRKPTVTMGVVG